jgi:hypothetical protein
MVAFYSYCMAVRIECFVEQPHSLVNSGLHTHLALECILRFFFIDSIALEWSHL